MSQLLTILAIFALSVPVIALVLPWVFIASGPLYGKYLDWVGSVLERWGLDLRPSNDTYPHDRAARAVKRYQFIAWWPCWLGVFFTRLDPAVTDLAYIYDWYLVLGFWEVRRWTTRKLPQVP